MQQDKVPGGVIECYLVAVCVVLNEAPKIMIMTHEGAMFCYVPPHAICFIEAAKELSLRDVCKWDCLANRGEVVELDFLRHFSVRWKSAYYDLREGKYLFSLHFDPNDAWCRFPEQLKIFHFLEGNDGNLHIAVNNQSRFLCGAIHEGEMEFIPQPNKEIWFCE